MTFCCSGRAESKSVICSIFSLMSVISDSISVTVLNQSSCLVLLPYVPLLYELCRAFKSASAAKTAIMQERLVWLHNAYVFVWFCEM